MKENNLIQEVQNNIFITDKNKEVQFQINFIDNTKNAKIVINTSIEIGEITIEIKDKE